ncbi:hypothetical protein DPMN_044963 [Dreissena polymorpha]|uniref:Uncharacterized protein n=1 Tax=Dreissena polymorpha TaxID=45954 RepID=A0A9D4D535_DREPO|nr:hypothetical protein DPMN_044963 [Dreissena polymorpha]
MNNKWPPGGHEDNVSSRLFTCFHFIHIEKIAPPPGAHVFPLITTIFKLVQDIHIANAKNVTSRVTPPGGHVFLLIQTIFELNCPIQVRNAPPLGSHTNLLTKFHEDWTINANVDVAKRTTDDGQKAITKAHHEHAQNIIGTNLAKFHEDRKINVASRVLTRKNALLPGSHVFQPMGIIFDLFQNIIRMNLLTKFHENRTVNVASRVKNAPPLGTIFFKQT